MAGRKVLVIGLDGYEQSLGNRMMQSGELPALSELKRKSSCWLLDHGSATRTGLAWEHFSTGLSPRDAERYSAVYFNPDNYHVWQQGTSITPFINAFAGKTVVFDPPYFNLQSLQNVRGMVNWGAHDPGISTSSQPAGLQAEIEEKFGPYPAKDWIYGITWQSAEKTGLMCNTLLAGIRKREEISCWLLKERITDWDMAMVVIGELHSATEGFWHGIDPEHPLHYHPSANLAGEGLKEIYRATDRFVQNMMQAFPEVTLVVFSMGGMGPNNADVPGMVLLPELLYRRSFGRPLLQQRSDWDVNSGKVPLLKSNESWSRAVRDQYPGSAEVNHKVNSGKSLLQRLRGAFSKGKPQAGKAFVLNLNWMPVMRYAFAWPGMEAFALPSFYDGRIRINLAGREKEGKVSLQEYGNCIERLQQFFLECRDQDNKPVVEKFECYEGDPFDLHPTGADLVIVWRGAALAIEHPDVGRIGPLPYRRTGGHTGLYGVAYITGPGIAQGEMGVRSSFDIAPTILHLLDSDSRIKLSGQSLLSLP